MGDIKQQYLLIDGSALLHRAYHALPAFNSTEGVPTNALFGFGKMVLSLLSKLKPQYISVVFDTPKPTFRKKLLLSYQAKRPKADEAFKVQVPLVQEFLKLAGIPLYFQEGYEADDVIATITRLALSKSPQLQIKIITGDKDILQLVNRQTVVLMPKSGVANLFFMDESAVKEKLGVLPNQIVDYKALVGDPSDNYGGIKGIGPKTAVKLLVKYQNIDNLYLHLHELDPNLKYKLEINKENALLSKRLAQLVDDVKVNFDLKKNVYQNISLNPELIKFCDRYGLRSLKKQLQQLSETTQKEKEVDKQSDNQLSFFK